MSRRLSRRRFLQTAAAITAGPLFLRADEKKPGPNERLHVGVVGTFDRGVKTSTSSSPPGPR